MSGAGTPAKSQGNRVLAPARPVSRRISRRETCLDMVLLLLRRSLGPTALRCRQELLLIAPWTSPVDPELEQIGHDVLASHGQRHLALVVVRLLDQEKWRAARHGQLRREVVVSVLRTNPARPWWIT